MVTTYNYDGQDAAPFKRAWDNGDSFRYAPGPHNLFAVFPPDTLPPWKPLVYCHGGYINSSVWRDKGSGYLPLVTSGTPSATEFQDYNDLGFCVITMEFDNGYMGSERIQTPDYEFAPYFQQQMPLLIQFLAHHYDNEEIWGINGQIDPTKFVVSGFSQGAQHAIMSAVQPPGYTPWGGDEGYGFHFGSSYGDKYVYDKSARVRAAICDEPLVDQSQAASATVPGAPTDGFADMNNQFWRPEEWRGNIFDSVDQISQSAMLAFSPWPYILREVVKPEDLALWCAWDLDTTPNNELWDFNYKTRTPTMVSAHSHIQVDPFGSLLVSKGWIDAADPSSSLSEVWGPAPAAGTGVQEITGQVKRTLKKSWLQNKVIPWLDAA